MTQENLNLSILADLEAQYKKQIKAKKECKLPAERREVCPEHTGSPQQSPRDIRVQDIFQISVQSLANHYANQAYISVATHAHTHKKIIYTLQN